MVLFRHHRKQAEAVLVKLVLTVAVYFKVGKSVEAK